MTARLILAAALMTAALPATAAQAAPHWSSPKQVVGPPADPDAAFVGSPQVRAFSDGRLLALTTDGADPLALTGTIGSGFAAPAKLGTGSSGSVVGDIGADGTAVAAWTSAGHAEVAIDPPGGTFGAATELPGDGVNAIDATVATDGSVVVVYRTHSKDGVYQALVASAPKGGGFGTPQVLESGKSGIGSFDVAAAPDGAVGATWTRISSVYRTRASLRPPGAAQFEAPQVLSSSPKADIEARIAFTADGTAVVAWANPDGGQFATRGPADAHFGAPAPVGHPAFTIDLEPTPQGSVALATAGDGNVYAGVLGAGGFGLTTVGAAPGNVPPMPAIAADAAGTVRVLYADSTSGEVRATTLGGGTTVIGYGKPGTLTAVALTAVGAGSAAALWHDAQDGISAATFGDDAPAAGGPGPKPGAADRKAPRISFKSATTIHVKRTVKSLALRLRCDEQCGIGIQSDLRATVKGKRLVAPLPFIDYRKAKLRSGTQTVTVKLNAGARTDLGRAFTAKRAATVTLRISARDGAGNVGTKTVRVTLREAKKKHSKK